MRTPIIAGNWKMNNNIEQSMELLKAIDLKALDKSVEALVCVPFTSLRDVAELLKDTDLKLGAQNMHWEESGAYTGEISPLMLSELGVDYVILGHSERRQYFNESDETVNKKVKSALNHNLNPILCVGESLEERENNRHRDVVKRQVKKGLEGVDQTDIDKIVIAYEPIWAIGTGKTASSSDADEMLGFIRETIEELYPGKSNIVRLQYGGSVKPENVGEFMGKENIDGALVGGASLKAASFMDLINF